MEIFKKEYIKHHQGYKCDKCNGANIVQCMDKLFCQDCLDNKYKTKEG